MQHATEQQRSAHYGTANMQRFETKFDAARILGHAFASVAGTPCDTLRDEIARLDAQAILYRLYTEAYYTALKGE